MAQEAGVPFLGSIPIDPIVREGGDQGTPVVISHPDTPAAAVLNGITDAILTRFDSGDLKGKEDIEIEITD
jgi:ATP-binding protein involved in chromosome partitioning